MNKIIFTGALAASTLVMVSSLTTSFKVALFSTTTLSVGRKSVENFGGSKVASPVELIISGPV